MAALPSEAGPVRLLIALSSAALPEWLETQPSALRDWVAASGFSAKPHTFCLLPEAGGGPRRLLYGVPPEGGLWALADAPRLLPEGRYRVEPWGVELAPETVALGWALGSYRFDAYKAAERLPAQLTEDGAGRLTSVETLAEAIGLTRDLINTPANAMMPHDLAAAAERMVERFGGRVRQVVGDALLADYPCLHAVGRASVQPPRLIDLCWGDETAPRVTLVGKGVCFDSGGLDIKPSKGMRQMKKDMGGAAHVLGLAHLIMAERLPVRLRVLIGAAENAIAGNAFRPGDVLRARNGLTIEVDNTDAEGRLAICDALSEASAERPELLIDFATLTGAARVAVGTEIAAYFSNDDALARELEMHAAHSDDPVWRLPLHAAYRHELESPIADLLNCGTSGYAGATTAALFLQSFIDQSVPWLHFDVMAWNLRQRPGRPVGGEAMGLRAVWALLQARFVSSQTEC